MANFYVASSGGSNSPYNNWGNASTSLKVALAAAAAGDRVYVASNTIDLTAGEVSLASNGASTNPVQVISVELGGSTQLAHIDNDDQGGIARDVAVGSSFVFLANSTAGLYSYSVGSTGALTYIDADDQGGNARDVAVGSSFVFLANYNLGLQTYSIGSTGALTYIDTDDQGGFAEGVAVGSSFVFLANNVDGLHIYSVGSTGALTHIDKDDQGGNARDVAVGSSFVFLANGAQGLLSYSVGSTGALTYIDSDDQGSVARDVAVGSSFVFLANSTGGLLSYSVGSTGALTFIDSDIQGGSTAICVSVDGDYVYLANSIGGISVYSVAGNGNLTLVDSTDRASSTALGISGNEKFVLVANGVGGLDTYNQIGKPNAGGNGTAGTTYLDYKDTNLAANDMRGVAVGSSFMYVIDNSSGLMSFSVAGDGSLTLLDADDQGGGPNDVAVGTSFVFVAEGSDGLNSYSVDGAGDITYIDSDDQGGSAKGVAVGSSFLFLANGSQGLLSYSVNGAGALTYIDTYDNAGSSGFGVAVGSSFVFYASDNGGLRSLSVDGVGDLTYIDADDQGGNARGVAVGSSFVFLANYDQGVLSYSVGSTGALTYIDTVDPGGLVVDVTVDDNGFLYTANNFGGISVFSVGSTGKLTLLDSTDRGEVYLGISAGSSFFFAANDDLGVESYTKFSIGAAASTIPQVYETMASGGGRIGTSGANNLILDANTIYTGIYFDASDNLWHNGAGTIILRDCKLDVDDNCTFGGANSDHVYIWENVDYNQITAGSISIDKGQLFWRSGQFTGASNLANGNLFTADTRGGHVVCEDLDLSDMDSGDYFFGGTEYNSQVLLKRCKLQNGSEPSLYNGTISNGNVFIETHSCSGSNIIYQLKEQSFSGTVETNTDVYADATYNGTNGYSVKMTASPRTTVWSRPLRFKLADLYSTAANPTLTVELITDDVELKNNQFWLEIEHPTSALGAKGNVDRTSRSSDILVAASTLTASGLTWTDGVGIDDQKMKVAVSTTNGQAGVHTVWACVAGTTIPVYVDPKVTKSF